MPSTRLAEQIRAETAQWQDFAETVLRGLLANTPLAGLVPARELAVAAVAAYLGMEMLSHIDADHTAPAALFDAAERAAAWPTRSTSAERHRCAVPCWPEQVWGITRASSVGADQVGDAPGGAVPAV